MKSTNKFKDGWCILPIFITCSIPSLTPHPPPQPQKRWRFFTWREKDVGRSTMVVDYHGPRYQAKSLLLQFHILIIVFSIKRFVFSLNLELSIAIFSSVINIHLLKITYLLITKQDISQYKIMAESEFSVRNSVNIYYIYIKE